MNDAKKSPHVDDASAGPSPGLDRRGFLKISSAVAAVAVAAPTLSAAQDRKQYSTAPKSSVKDLKGGWFMV